MLSYSIPLIITRQKLKIKKKHTHTQVFGLRNFTLFPTFIFLKLRSLGIKMSVMYLFLYFIFLIRNLIKNFVNMRMLKNLSIFAKTLKITPCQTLQTLLPMRNFGYILQENLVSWICAACLIAKVSMPQVTSRLLWTTYLSNNAFLSMRGCQSL